MTYRLLPRAEADIEEIGDYISRQNPGAALRLIETFMRRWNLLALYPLFGAPVEGVGSGIRHVVVGDYVTFYRVDADAVEILRVLHGRRNIERDEVES